MFENPCGANSHIVNENFVGFCKKRAGGNGNLIINFAWSYVCMYACDCIIWGSLPQAGRTICQYKTLNLKIVHFMFLYGLVFCVAMLQFCMLVSVNNLYMLLSLCVPCNLTNKSNQAFSGGQN